MKPYVKEWQDASAETRYWVRYTLQIYRMECKTVKDLDSVDAVTAAIAILKDAARKPKARK